MTKSDRSARLNLHVSSNQKREVEEAARVVDLSLSEFIRQALTEKTSKILHTRRAA